MLDHGTGQAADLAVPLDRDELIAYGPWLSELPALRVAAEVGEIQHLGLLAAQAVGVRGLEQGGVPEGRQPALAAFAADAQDFLVSVVEERFQLGPGEGPAFRLALGFIGVRRGVPVVDHLDGVGPEVPQELVAPAIGRIGQEVAELAHGTLVVPQGGADAAVHGPQIRRPLIDVLRRPLPRHGIGMLGEGPDRAFLVVDVSRREIPGELLVAPALDHRLEDSLVRPQQRQTVDQMQPSRTWNEAPSPLICHHSPSIASDARISHQMRRGGVFAVQPLDGVRSADTREFPSSCASCAASAAQPRGAVCGRKHVMVRTVEVEREPGRVTGSGDPVRPRLGEKND
ncbi:hypothetical protein [Streptomyces sp. SID12488]|uniref:hypothetical protein n=1 Tax=Streptomyces sp. SID12488 TaxID=2706040 RepID=UPI0013DA5026|nr:hypothetical protein [Streptomyces sp. SID12488]NEA67279.1 hypothetical protein [Streptomyces sp. SID12488]